jgi:hypothetical protein
MIKMINKKGLTIIFLIVNTIVYGQTIITDRPDQTESSSTIPKGSLQIEAGFLLGSSDNDIIKERQILAPSILSRYGLTNGIELRLLTQFESIKNRSTDEVYDGISDLEIGAKVQLFKKESSTTEIAFLSHLILPTASKQLTNDKFGSINKLSISHPLSESIGIGYNVGYDYFGMGNGNFTYSLALGIGLTNTMGIYLEPYGAVIDFKTHEASFDVGVTYLPKDNLQFDLSYGIGLNHTMNYISVGCSVNIAKKKKD